MNIFLDEAGPFVIPPNNTCSISCVGALVLPESDTESIFKKFVQLKKSWGVGENDEIKGSKLNEQQVSAVIDSLSLYDVIFHATCIDMNLLDEQFITRHRLRQAASITENITSQHHESVKKEAEQFKASFEKLHNQLYIQASCVIETLYNILQTSTLYFSQRKAQELGEFYWYIDSKDKKITPFENLWTSILLPALQDKSLKHPFAQILEGADYSYFEKYLKQFPEAPGHVKHVVKNESPFLIIDIHDIFKKNLNFCQSHNSLGIQLVDILTTNLRRALNGRLNRTGWENIGKLMVEPVRRSHVIHFMTMADNDYKDTYITKYSTRRPPYRDVYPIIDSTCKKI